MKEPSNNVKETNGSTRPLHSRRRQFLPGCRILSSCFAVIIQSKHCSNAKTHHEKPFAIPGKESTQTPATTTLLENTP
jgi:hypothetical protein